MIKHRLKRGKTKDKRHLNATDTATPDATGTEGTAGRIKVAHSRVRIYYIRRYQMTKRPPQTVSEERDGSRFFVRFS
jgi:hypothetical protein